MFTHPNGSAIAFISQESAEVIVIALLSTNIRKTLPKQPRLAQWQPLELLKYCLNLREIGENLPVPQVSVFLDNHPGSLSQVIGKLDQNQIRIFALSIAEAGEFGLVRLIVEDPAKATKLLEDAEFNLAKSRKNIEVAVVMITEKDKVSRITKVLGDSGLNIDYAYSSAVHMDGKFSLVLRANDLEKAERTLKENGVSILSLAEIKQHFQ